MNDAFHDLFHDFCQNRCIQADKSYPLWHKMQPCLNCPAASFAEYLGDNFETAIIKKGGD